MLPIVYCQARYHRPMGHGDVLRIHLACRQLDPTSFEIHYDVYNNQQVVATGLTRHLCIHPATPATPDSAHRRWALAGGRSLPSRDSQPPGQHPGPERSRLFISPPPPPCPFLLLPWLGAPNVGKSTLVNRLAESRQAIVADQPGITRDRTYQEAEWGGRRFRLVDTGGLIFDDDSTFLPEIREQVGLALAEACAVVMVVDGQQGLTTADQTIASWLRNRSLPVLLAVNKCESPQMGAALAADFWSLALGEPLAGLQSPRGGDRRSAGPGARPAPRATAGSGGGAHSVGHHRPAQRGQIQFAECHLW